MQQTEHFFWGGYMRGRFHGYPQDWCRDADRVVLLKGGAGTGKSTLMRRVMASWERQGRTIYAFHCASDPMSLDALCTADGRLAVLDATAPHAVEARFPVAVERIVDLSEGLSYLHIKEVLPQLKKAEAEGSDLRRRAGRYLRLATRLAREEERAMRARVAPSVLSDAAMRMARQAFGGERGNERERHAYLTAVTPDGMWGYYNTLTALCPRIFVLEGDAAVAAQMLAQVRRYAVTAGVACITCPCALRPDCIEHILLPSVGAAFTTSHRFHEVDFPVYRRLSMARYRATTGKPTDKNNRCRAQEEALQQAIFLLQAARAVHHRTETFYGAAMDWGVVDSLAAQTVAWLQ